MTASPFSTIPAATSPASRPRAQRDFVADYVKAARAGGMLVGLYYSPLDWRFPGFFFPDLQLQKRRGDARPISPADA